MPMCQSNICYLHIFAFQWEMYFWISTCKSQYTQRVGEMCFPGQNLFQILIKNPYTILLTHVKGNYSVNPNIHLSHSCDNSESIFNWFAIAFCVVDSVTAWTRLSFALAKESLLNVLGGNNTSDIPEKSTTIMNVDMKLKIKFLWN
jgi:hypothetical protein